MITSCDNSGLIHDFLNAYGREIEPFFQEKYSSLFFYHYRTMHKACYMMVMNSERTICLVVPHENKIYTWVSIQGSTPVVPSYNGIITKDVIIGYIDAVITAVGNKIELFPPTDVKSPTAVDV